MPYPLHRRLSSQVATGAKAGRAAPKQEDSMRYFPCNAPLSQGLPHPVPRIQETGARLLFREQVEVGSLSLAKRHCYSIKVFVLQELIGCMLFSGSRWRIDPH